MRGRRCPPNIDLKRRIAEGACSIRVAGAPRLAGTSHFSRGLPPRCILEARAAAHISACPAIAARQPGTDDDGGRDKGYEAVSGDQARFDGGSPSWQCDPNRIEWGRAFIPGRSEARRSVSMRWRRARRRSVSRRTINATWAPAATCQILDHAIPPGIRCSDATGGLGCRADKPIAALVEASATSAERFRIAG